MVGTSTVLGHPDALVLPTLPAILSRHIGGIRTVLKVAPAGCHQCGFERSRPLVVGLGESPHLVGCQAEFPECRSECLAAVDRVEELLAHLGWESLVRLAPEACPGGVVLRFTASVAIAAFQPAGQGAVGYLRAAAATLGIGLITDLLQLLQCPWRISDQSKRQPPADNWRCHIAHCGCLAD